MAGFRKKFILTIVTIITLSACVQSQEIQMAKNVYRLDLSSGGIGADGRVAKEASKRAAALTLQKGYTHFVLADASSGSSVHTIGTTPITAHRFGGVTTFTGGQPIARRVAAISVTVVMFNETDPRAATAIDARQVQRD